MEQHQREDPYPQKKTRNCEKKTRTCKMKTRTRNRLHLWSQLYSFPRMQQGTTLHLRWRYPRRGSTRHPRLSRPRRFARKPVQSLASVIHQLDTGRFRDNQHCWQSVPPRRRPSLSQLTAVPAATDSEGPPNFPSESPHTCMQARLQFKTMARLVKHSRTIPGERPSSAAVPSRDSASVLWRVKPGACSA